MRRHSVSFGCAIVMTTAAFVGVAAPAGAASPASVACGSKIVTSVKLHHDLVGCPGDGLVVGAPGITIDLNGHTISGTNAPGGEGIADDGYGHVVVEHGTIRGFFVNGIGLRQAPWSLVRNLTIRNIGAGGVEDQFSSGIVLDGSPGTRIRGNSISNDVVAWEADGIVVKRSAVARVDHNRLNRNSWDGLFVLASPHTQVDHNVASDNPNNGMEINGSSDFTRVTDNETSGNGNVGLVAGSIGGAVIDRNTAARNGFGGDADNSGLFFFDLHDSEIANNRASGNGVGIDLFGGLHGSTGNRVVGNVANENTIIGLLIDSGDGGTLANGANQNLVRGNSANRNRGSAADGGAGVGVFGGGNLLLRNRADGNTANGFLVVGPGNALVQSGANGNGRHGINAIAGTIDGGGNRAHGNLPPQCLGVTCH
jgi:parallel beta-helix repeat protein